MDHNLIVVRIDGGYNDTTCDSHILHDNQDQEPPRCTGNAVCVIKGPMSDRKACRSCIDAVKDHLLGASVEYFT